MPITHPEDKPGITSTVTPTPMLHHVPNLGHNYILQKYMFRFSSLMPSSRWYKVLNINSIYTTGMSKLGVA
jgi:hypothetical protein